MHRAVKTSIDETNKTQQKVRGSKFIFKMSTIQANTCIQTTTPLRNCCRYWRCGPAASIPPADVLSTPSHHGFANGRPSLSIPRCCSPLDSNLAIGWPRLWRDKIWHLSLQHGDKVVSFSVVSVCGCMRVFVDAITLEAFETSSWNFRGSKIWSKLGRLRKWMHYDALRCAIVI